MSSKTVLWMIIIIVMGGVSLYVTSESDYTAPLETPVAIASFSQLDVEQVTRIEMTKGDSAVLLVRGDQGWQIPSAWDSPGDRVEIAKLLSDLRSIASAERRASSSTSHSDFQVDDDEGLRISLQDANGSSMGDLVLGKRDGSGRSFIRIAGQDEVYSVTPNLLFRSGFGGETLKVDSWADKNLFRLAPDANVVRLTIGSKEELIRLERSSPEETEVGAEAPLLDGVDDLAWMIVEPERVAADEATVSGILSSLKNVLAAEPADPTLLAEYGLEPPTEFIEMELSDGSTFIVAFGHEAALSVGGEGVYAKVVGANRVAILRSYVRDALLRPLETLRAAEPTVEAVTDPVVDPIADPIVDPPLEPVAEPTPEVPESDG